MEPKPALGHTIQQAAALLLGLLMAACLTAPSQAAGELPQSSELPAIARPLGQAVDRSGMGYEIFSHDTSGAYVCPPQLVQRVPARCPAYGPGARQVRIAYLSQRLPDPLPALQIEPLPQPEGSITRYLYGQIINYPAPTYRHPAEAEAGLPPLRVFRSNINWVSVVGQVEYNGQVWVQINRDEYIAPEHITFPEPSRFQGIRLAETPSHPFAWLRRDLETAPQPGARPAGEVLARRTLVTVFAVEEVDGARWLMVGPDQWINHAYVSMVTPDSAPQGVSPAAKWIEVDTYEQTLAAYEGDRLVYATLITAGKADLTPLGIFRIFRKVRAALMESYDRSMDDEYWFYLEDVEHAQFFNERISLHAAYWHDYFGTRRSNGCVNLTPLDARWLYAWTDPQLDPGGSWSTPESAGEGQTWVWVRHSGPAGVHKP